MYSESDLQSAVAAGAISAEAAQALRAHVAQGPAAAQGASFADEENIRLLSGFNDIFVSIACLLVIFSGIYVGSEVAGWLGGALVALTSWLMAEVFTRKRRMALPSIILLIAFVTGLGFAASGLAGEIMPKHDIVHSYPFGNVTNQERFAWQEALMALAGSLAAGIGAALHWWRFRVAITIAAGIGAIVLLLLSGVAAITDKDIGNNAMIAPAALACGLAVFAFAMRWDLSDRKRVTQRADIAFWLHLLAAPLVAHPLFFWMGVFAAGTISPVQGIGVLAIYLVFAAVALIVDRRALLVSALVYVLAALYNLIHSFGSLQFALAITTLVIGCALLALSVFWAPLRKGLLKLLPEGWRERLPVAA